ncbi:GNAT family N-acetyltransferase [Metabacillus sp. GX 13764]|uniref:GNAT family N-acetyltransferase n=1 Tax=Metabacillus kandeliae TaxID=2900151 RepID=UPI001E3B6AB6|nr:GNAT family N-acetyltransferase [Metabacillus kandeliae]MCD7035953.1 GNAT family N-acetyltransferase [Metabacillus kandeliae]
MLTAKQLVDIKELQRDCESGENFELKLNWDMLRTRPENETTDFFFYEKERLLGFLAIYEFGHKAELCGMVHPEHRRKGIFTNLFKQAEKQLEEKQYKRILLNAPANSQSAKGLLKSFPCSYSFSEYQMKWHEKELHKQPDVLLRPAEPADMEMEVLLDVKCFGFEESDARAYNERILAVDDHYMIDWNKKTLGKMRLSFNEGEAWVYGFAVLPEYQGKGIGRKALTNAILAAAEKGYPIFLEVEAKNAHALKLYEACGFQAYSSQDYYLLA